MPTLQLDSVRAATALLSLHARAGRVAAARQVFDSMPNRNCVSYNAMITCYAQNGDTHNARKVFEESPDKDAVSWNSMISGYFRAHKVREAKELFEMCPEGERNLVSWTVMIAGHSRVCEFRKAWGLVVDVQRQAPRIVPDQSWFVSVISVVVGLKDLVLLESLRSWAVKSGMEGDVVVGTAVLNAYSRIGFVGLEAAARFFEWMPERNEYSWSTMIAAFSQFGWVNEAIACYERTPYKSVACQSAVVATYARSGRIRDARVLFDGIPKPNVVLWNSMITGYCRNDMVEEAKGLFYAMPVHNATSWAAMIAGLAQCGRSVEALELLQEFHRIEMFPGHSSITSSLFACSNIGDLATGRQIHTLAVKAGCQFNSCVWNGLISMYAKCSNWLDLNHAFKNAKVKDTVSWNSLITGLSHNDMVADAREAFEQMPIRDVISWTAIISAYIQAGLGSEALMLFLEMLHRGIMPNPSTISSIISTCAEFSSMRLGQQAHCLAIKIGNELELFVSNALITLYFKCGSVDAFQVFDEMPEHDTVTWNAMLTGCGHHGFGKDAIEIFNQMKSEGAYPNQVTFLTLLCACSHAGLVNEAWEFFHSMTKDYGIMPLGPHYTCMVDLLGRAGRLYEAEALIESMPVEPDSVVWLALLGACRIHRNIEIGEKVADVLFQMDPQISGTYILLSNLYASVGMWNEVGEVRKLMKQQGLTKDPGCSWIHIKNKLYSFTTGERGEHEQVEEIKSKLTELYARLRSTGYYPDTTFVLHDVEEEQKASALLFHSEKLAVTYALLNGPKDGPIHVMKNLRICGDCHMFMKFLSKDCGRLIVVRDRNRFHHFRDGICSCGDYW